MVVALLIILALATVTGLMAYGAEKHAGPLAGLLRGASEPVGDAFEEIHDFFRPPRSSWSDCTLLASP